MIFLRPPVRSTGSSSRSAPQATGDSPYQSFSSFAGNPYYIDLDLLIKDGLLKRSELEGIDWGSDPEHVDYGRIFENRYRVLRLAYERGAEKLSAELESFRRENGWLENYALYMSLKSHFGMLSWTEWPEEDIRLHKAWRPSRNTRSCCVMR